MRRVRMLSACFMPVLLLLCLLGGALFCAFSPATYAADSRASLAPMREQEITGYLGMDAQEQALLGARIAGYFRGAAQDMDYVLPGGTHAFNEKELSHMADVRALLGIGVRVAACLAAALVLCEIALGLACRRISPAQAARARFSGMLWGLLALFLLLAGLAMWALVDFRALFELFHRIAFTNEDWLLDPRTDRLIRMMPQALFETLCARIAAFAACVCALTLGAAGAWNLKKRKEEKR